MGLPCSVSGVAGAVMQAALQESFTAPRYLVCYIRKCVTLPTYNIQPICSKCAKFSFIYPAQAAEVRSRYSQPHDFERPSVKVIHFIDSRAYMLAHPGL